MKAAITFPVPVTDEGEFDLEAQEVLARRFGAVADVLRSIKDDTAAALDVVPASTDQWTGETDSEPEIEGGLNTDADPEDVLRAMLRTRRA